MSNYPNIVEKIFTFTLCGAIAIILMISAYFYVSAEIKLIENREKAEVAEVAQTEKVKEINCGMVNKK